MTEFFTSPRSRKSRHSRGGGEDDPVLSCCYQVSHCTYSAHKVRSFVQPGEPPSFRCVDTWLRTGTCDVSRRYDAFRPCCKAGKQPRTDRRQWQVSVAPCPRLGRQRSDRGFGGRIVKRRTYDGITKLPTTRTMCNRRGGRRPRYPSISTSSGLSPTISMVFDGERVLGLPGDGSAGLYRSGLQGFTLQTAPAELSACHHRPK
jgi:hypothetical protein